MIVHVAEKDLGGLLKDGGFGPRKIVHDIAEGPDRTPEKQQLALEGVDLPQRLGLRVRHHDLLQGFDFFSDRFQDGKILVDDGIHKCMEQIVGTRLPHSTLASAEPFPNRLEDIAAVLLEGEHEVPS